MQKIRFSKKALSLFLMVVMLSGVTAGFSPLSKAESMVDLPSLDSAESEAVFPWYDTSLTFAERATALVAEMTEAEKVALLTTSTPSIPRLKVRDYDWWREAITGPQMMPAVSIPTSYSLGHTWNPDLRHKTASVIGIETRVWFNDRFRWLGQYSPTVEPARDPRWGRNEETYSEDPLLSGEMGVAFIRGMQFGDYRTGEDYVAVTPSQDPRNYTVNEHGEQYLKAMATAKHFAANNSEGNRSSGSSNMSDKILREYYTVPYEIVAKKADSAAFMTAYNRVNWTIAFGHTYLNNTLLRKTWGFDGFIVTDCGGTGNTSGNHAFKPGSDRIYGTTHPDLKETYGDRTVTTAEGIAFSLMGGTDQSCEGTTNGRRFNQNFDAPGNNANNPFWFWHTYPGVRGYKQHISSTIENKVLTDNGVISWDDVDRSLVRMFTKRIATGEFDKLPEEANVNAPDKWDTGGLYGSYRPSTILPDENGNTPDSMDVGTVHNANNRGVGIHLGDKDTENPEHVAVGLQASREGVVLLKNDEINEQGDKLLPIKVTGPDAVKTIALAGRLFNHCEDGDFRYTPQPGWQFKTTLLTGLRKALEDLAVDGDIKVNYYFPAANSTVSGNIFNFEKFIINGQTVNAGNIIAGSSSTTLTAVPNGILSTITDRSYATYEVPAGAYSEGGLIINQFDISVSTDGIGSGTTAQTLPIVEVREGTPNGQLLGTITASRTANLLTYSIGKGAFQEVTLHGGYGNHVLCLVFTTSRSVVNGYTSEALDAMKSADAVIYTIGGVKVGTDLSRPTTGPDSIGRASGLSGVGGEGSDAGNLNIPGTQLAELNQVLNTGAKVILPIRNSRILDISTVVDKIPAILFECFNGQSAGDALAETLLGINNPSGRLSTTWYADQNQLPNIRDYAMRPGEYDSTQTIAAGTGFGRTYQYFIGDVLFPFGHGLSYTDFELKNASLSKSTVTTAEEFKVSLDVTNTGAADGKEVVQVYLVSPNAGICNHGVNIMECAEPKGVGGCVMKVPFRQLKGFEKVDVAAGQTKKVEITLNSEDFWFIEEKPYDNPYTENTLNDTSGKRIVSPGAYKIEVATFADRDGDASATERIELPFTIGTVVAPRLQTVTLMGDKITVTKDQPVNTSLFLALSDESFIQPSQAAVVYTSNRPTVAQVDSTGKITAGAFNGTAVITATVTYGGKTLEATYAVVSEGGGAFGTRALSDERNGALSVAVDVFSGPETFSANVLSAVYNQSGKLIAVSSKPIDLSEMSLGRVDFTLDVSKAEGDYLVKVFFWDKVSFIPLLDPIEPNL